MMEPKITIRNYTKNDWQMVKSWWDSSGEIGPVEAMMPPNSSFIAELDGNPSLAVCLYLTNTPIVAYVENFIGNPEFRGPYRREATQILLDHISDFAFKCGYKHLLCMTDKPALKLHYESIGFKRTLDGVATFVKETICQQQQ